MPRSLEKFYLPSVAFYGQGVLFVGFVWRLYCLSENIGNSVIMQNATIVILFHFHGVVCVLVPVLLHWGAGDGGVVCLLVCHPNCPSVDPWSGPSISLPNQKENVFTVRRRPLLDVTGGSSATHAVNPDLWSWGCLL